tara:strand:- start:2985 stop:3311 length:327 start_codon:yes stop_codon:yes gene_type:complete
MNEDQEKARTLAVNTEAARAGLFAAAADMLTMMKEAGVEHGEAAVVTGAVEFAVQLWDKTMLGAGNTPKASREALEAQIKFFLNKHREIAVSKIEAGAAILANPEGEA